MVITKEKEQRDIDDAKCDSTAPLLSSQENQNIPSPFSDVAITSEFTLKHTKGVIPQSQESWVPVMASATGYLRDLGQSS